MIGSDKWDIRGEKVSDLITLHCYSISDLLINFFYPIKHISIIVLKILSSSETEDYFIPKINIKKMS